MINHITRHWHAVLFEISRGTFQHIFLQVPVESAPFRKIKVLAAFVYMIFNGPGNRCDISVTRINRLIGMAVIAGVFQQAADFWRSLHHIHKILLPLHRPVRPVYGNKLDQRNEDQKPENNITEGFHKD